MDREQGMPGRREEIAAEIAKVREELHAVRRHLGQLQLAILHDAGYRNGVHIDEKGQYWMRKPGAWYHMAVYRQPATDSPKGRVARLREAKD